MDRWVRDYSGTKIRIQCEESELQTVLYEKLVAPYIADLEYSWMSGTKAEERAKGYLDYIGSLMIRQPDTHNVVDPRKMRKIHTIELTGEGAAEIAREMRPVRSRAKPKRKKQMRCERIDQIHKKYPGCKITICGVDTEGWFTYKGMELLLSGKLETYAPKNAGNDVLYDMDRVMVVENSKGLFFYDQDANPIDAAYVLAEMTSDERVKE